MTHLLFQEMLWFFTTLIIPNKLAHSVKALQKQNVVHCKSYKHIFCSQLNIENINFSKIKVSLKLLAASTFTKK